MWHCHILGHEENDMMRDQVFQVPPQTPTNLAVAGLLTGGNVTFTDQSLSETGFTVERALDAAFTQSVTDLTLPAQPGYNTQVTYLDNTATPGRLYYYRVRTFKPDVDFYAPGNDLLSAWSSTAQTTLTPTATVSPTSLAFGNQLLTAPAQTLPLTLTNAGFTSLTIFGISVTGTNSGLFSQTNACPASLASGTSCIIYVTFTPVSIGSKVAQIAIASNDPTNPTLNVPLTGQGQVALTVTASSTTIQYGSAVPTITATASGLVSPDTIASLTGLTCSTTYTPTSTLGTYPSTCLGAVNANYVITYVAGKVTVTPSPAAITSPANGSTLSGASATFTWSPSGPTPSQYALYVGTQGQGSSNVLHLNSTTATSYTVNNIPTLGGAVNVTLYWYINGVTYSAFYTYKQAGSTTPAAMTSPAAGSTLPGTSATFTWTPSNPVPTNYALYVGSQGTGSSNILHLNSTTATTYTVNNIPILGGTVNVRLYWYIGGSTFFADYTYKMAGSSTPAAIISPAPGSTLPGASATFTWTPSNPAPTNYLLLVGTQGAGTSNILYLGPTTATSYTVNNLPITGGKVYVTLYWYINGSTFSAKYVYTAF